MFVVLVLDICRVRFRRL